MSDERTESRGERSGRNEAVAKGGMVLWGLCPQTPGILSLLMPIPVDNFVAGAQLETGPSLVLAPESALRLLPSIALSSAPSVRSVCATSNVAQDGTKKS